MGETIFDYEVQFGGFDRLMPFRVREILLVASPYDAFIFSEDDRLTELIFSEYLDLNLRYAPRVTRVSSAAEALERLRQDRFDLLITMMRVGPMDVGAFALAAKEIAPKTPVVLLAYSQLDIQRLAEEDRARLDDVFLWLGDIKILLAIIKHIEDQRNIDHDIECAGVQTIILIEDSVRFTSYYLPLIYTELMGQTQKLMAEGVNLTHKLLRMRARPKILQAANFEEAWRLYLRYHSNLLCLITDIQFPRDGKLDPEAGLELIKRVKRENPDTPVLLQSSDSAAARKVEGLGATFLDKSSQNLVQDIRDFLMEQCGFGDFSFRLPDGGHVGRARDLHSLVELLKTAPEECIAYHSSRNHFSKWLMARTEFELAYRLRPVQISQFNDVGELRHYLIDTTSHFLHQTQVGVVADFSTRFFTDNSPFVKLGGGSFGGKGRGLAFLNSFLSRRTFSRRWEGIYVRVPNSVVIAADIFDAFMDQNKLRPLALSDATDAEIRDSFSRAALPEETLRALETFAQKVEQPLAVRSSSMMEDSHVLPFAGVYETYMLPNNHPAASVRLEQLTLAIKMVYASTFSQKARNYLAAMPHLREQEKMAVVVQHLVGQTHGDRYYPSFSGVAQSYNYYPVGGIKPTDGLAYVALGLGRTVVEGRRSLSFSPAFPQKLYQFSSAREILVNAQREFFALDLGWRDFRPDADSGANLLSLDLEAAEEDGTLAPVGSTYSAENDRVYDGIFRKGPRLVTFANVLKSDVFPLASLLAWTLEVGEQAVGCPVEIEFAVDIYRNEFNILQIRPMVSWGQSKEVKLDPAEQERAVCYSHKALGHGQFAGISDIVYVVPERFDVAKTRLIAREIGQINERLKKEGRGCMLIGPGRWGSADSSLGIPVNWREISAARLIVETTLENFDVEPSFGTHFLHNVVALGIGYLTVRHMDEEGKIDWDWLGRQKAFEETSFLRHIRLDKPLDVRIDG
ncbi:MAG: histidine kinase, partial [Elusimicrobia bacterium]|nr:histidine kinase [Elusimicrobiota bacterium]